MASVDVHGVVLTTAGKPPGLIYFRPSVPLSGPGSVLVPTEVVARPDAVTGEFTVRLSSTDDPTVDPLNWTWEVTEAWYEGRRFLILLPGAVSLVEYDSLVPASPDGLVYAPAVTSVNGMTGDVVVTGGTGGAHPNLAAHDTLGLATDAELAAGLAGKASTGHNHAGAYDPAGSAAAAQAAAVQRANHTGQQTSATISDFTEAVQDAVAALLGAGSNVTLNYDDAGNTLTITAAGGGGGLDAEAVRDAIGVALVGVGLVGVAVNDALDTITISTTATQNATDAALRDRTTHTGAQAMATITGLTAALAGKVDTTDPALTNARTPTAHKSTHATGGTDVLSPADIGAATSGAPAAAVTAHEAASDPHAQYLTQTEGDGRYVRTVNGTAPNGAGNVTVAGGSSALPVIQTTGHTRVPLIPDTWSGNGNANGNGSTVVLNHGKILYVPFVVQKAVTLASMLIQVVTAADAASGSAVRLGIYDSDGTNAFDGTTGMPGTLLQEAGEVATDSTGAKTATFGVQPTLQPGHLYWVAIAQKVLGATTPAFRGAANGRAPWLATTGLSSANWQDDNNYLVSSPAGGYPASLAATADQTAIATGTSASRFGVMGTVA